MHWIIVLHPCTTEYPVFSAFEVRKSTGNAFFSNMET